MNYGCRKALAPSANLPMSENPNCSIARLRIAHCESNAPQRADQPDPAVVHSATPTNAIVATRGVRATYDGLNAFDSNLRDNLSSAYGL